MDPPEYDVLILGAGVAGLAAGRLLANAGRHVAILEARPRVGGRIWTETAALENAAPIPVELGAEFIHGLPQTTWAVAAEANLKTDELSGSSLQFVDGQLAAHSEQQGDLHRVLEEMAEWLASQPAGRDMNFAQYLDTNPPDVSMRESVVSYVEGFNAADQHQIGIAALAEQQRAEDAIDAGRLFRVQAGYAAIPNFLTAQFVRAGGKLVLGAPVRRVEWHRESVAVDVSASRGMSQYRACRAIITLPLGVLQAEAVEFAPRPEEVLRQAGRLAMGAAVRVVLIFRKKFWCEQSSYANRRGLARELKDLSFLFAPAELPSVWWTPMPHHAAVLTGWSGGPKAKVLQGLNTVNRDRSALLDRCLAALARIFGIPLGELESLLLSWHTHDWDADEYSRGAYSFVPAGALDAPERMARPVEDTLYFAGEHTDTSGHWGTVHAALATGVRAARQVLRARTDPT